MGTHLILPRFPPTCCSVSPRLIFPTKIHYSTQTRTLTTPLQAPSLTPRFSPGVDAEALSISLNKLLRGSGGRWILTKDGEAVERNFKFKTFSKTWVRRGTITSSACVWMCEIWEADGVI